MLHQSKIEAINVSSCELPGEDAGYKAIRSKENCFINYLLMFEGEPIFVGDNWFSIRFFDIEDYKYKFTKAFNGYTIKYFNDNFFVNIVGKDPEMYTNCDYKNVGISDSYIMKMLGIPSLRKILYVNYDTETCIGELSKRINKIIKILKKYDERIENIQSSILKYFLRYVTKEDIFKKICPKEMINEFKIWYRKKYWNQIVVNDMDMAATRYFKLISTICLKDSHEMFYIGKVLNSDSIFNNEWTIMTKPIVNSINLPHPKAMLFKNINEFEEKFFVDGFDISQNTQLIL